MHLYEFIVSHTHCGQPSNVAAVNRESMLIPTLSKLKSSFFHSRGFATGLWILL